MRFLTGFLVIGAIWNSNSVSSAQPPGGGPGRGPGGGLSKAGDAGDLESRMMAFDADKDGTLTRDEVTDERLVRLFNRADVDKNGKVTKAELFALGEREHVEDQGGPPGGGPGFGPPGGGPGGPQARPGEILSPTFQQRLDLSAEQRDQLEKLQTDVDARLEEILSDGQRSQLRAARQRGPNGFGAPPGGRRRGGPGGGPPGDGPAPR